MQLIQFIQHRFPSPSAIPLTIVVINRFPWGKLIGQQTPLYPGLIQVENGVYNSAFGMLRSGSTPVIRRIKVMLDQLPFFIGYIAVVDSLNELLDVVAFII